MAPVLLAWVWLFIPGFNFATEEVDLIASIIDEYYTQRQVPLLIQGENQDVVDGVIGRLRFSRLIQINSNLIGYQSWKYVVTFIESYSNFQRIAELYSSQQFNHFGYYTVIYRNVSESEIQLTFRSFWQLQITKAVLIVSNDDNSPLLYSYTPYSRNKCGTPTIHSFELPNRTTPLFQAHFTDFHECPLRFGTFESLPFIHFTPTSTGDDRRTAVAGFEGELVSTIAGKLSFRIDAVVPSDGIQWGVARRNGSTGLMKILQDGTVHFGAGCLGLSADRNEILQPGTSHYASRVVFAVPDGHPYSAFEKLFRPYERSSWIAIGITVCVAGATILLLSLAPRTVRQFIYGTDNQVPFYNTISIFFIGSVHRTPRRNFARTLLILWMIFCLEIRTVYQGLLFKYLRSDSNHEPVDTLAGIERSELYYHMLQISERFFQNNTRVLSRVRHIPQGNDSLNAAMDAIAIRRLADGVVMVTTEHIAFHNKHRLDKGFLRSTRDYVVSLPIVIYYPKRSFLVPEFNRVIGQVQTAGLMSYWVRQYGNYDFFPKETRDQLRPVPLNIEQLSGCYQVCAVLWMVCCGVFLLELWSRKWHRLRIVLDFLAHQ
ncbi:uncharacterized protein LOC128746450 [Sabethes cyaneus]|uniref:uncharacterized protein LOC128746450 n=1 Tax=Sabethes cyaneus TaxID=53552 RepID=UPI00237E8B96|nr:uncharacterized protein LOC128746450 [Sabethes cyaneus]